MAPQRARGPPEEIRSDPLSKPTPISSASKGRRTATAAQAGGSNLKDVTSNLAAEIEDQLKQQNGSLDASTGGINWSTLPTSTLHSYRHAYRLNTSSAFTSAYNQLVLTGRGLGRFSPTMASRPKDRRRVSKEHLALAVRKDFNAAAVSEQEVVTSFLYSIHNHDKKFRMRFAPGRNR